jgi:hypothetical protein
MELQIGARRDLKRDPVRVKYEEPSDARLYIGAISFRRDRCHCTRTIVCIRDHGRGTFGQ